MDIQFCINDKFEKIKSKIQDQKCNDNSFLNVGETFGPRFTISNNYLALYKCPGKFDEYSNSGYIDKFSTDEKSRIVFAYYHCKLNELLKLLNNKVVTKDGYFWADKSRELIFIKDNIQDLIDCGITINSCYKEILESINFLNKLYGSQIPPNFTKVKLIEYDKIFSINKNSNLSNDSIKTLKDISLSSIDYINFTDDGKIRYLNEAIEFLLKDQNGKYVEINEDMFFGLISNNNCKEYRKKTQIFRHQTKCDIENRNNLKDYEKNFLVNYGETIVNRLLHLKKYEKKY